MITGYGHFVQLAESLQWDETTIDLTTDIESWTKLEDSEYDQILGLLAGFCVGETSVALHLGSFQSKATVDDAMAGCFESQARDEARHARFFDRVVSEVVGIPGKNLNERLEVLRERVSPELLELFEERLPAIARGLADSDEELTTAVGLYHMILEGVVLTAGQHALLDALEKLSVPMPGHAQGHGTGAARRALAHRLRLPGHPERRPRRQRPRENPQRGLESGVGLGRPHLLQGHREGRPAPQAPTQVRRDQVLVIPENTAAARRSR